MEQARLRVRLVRLLVASACAGLATAGASAQSTFPERPLRLVNPYTPGGTVDLVGRAMAQGLAERFGHQVIVDNRPGGGTTIGTQIVVDSEPNGYTALITTSAIAIMPSLYGNLRFDPARDLRPTVLVANTPMLLVVHAQVKARTVKDLIEMARAQPGRIPAASSGVGTTTHLTLEMFRSEAKADLLHVPYKGGGPALADLLGGQVKAFFNPPGAVLPHVRSERLRALAVTSSERVPYAQEVPTVAEAAVPGFESYIWYGVYLAKETPEARVQRWNTAINAFLQSDEAAKHYARNFFKIVGGTSEAFAKYHASETQRWAKVVRDAGMKAR